MRAGKTILKCATVMCLVCMFLVAGIPMASAGGPVKTSCGRPGWYFAEGYTGGDFDTWILIQNPNETDAIAHCRFFTRNGEPVKWDIPLAKETRYTVYLNTIPGLEEQEVATEVICEGDGVVAERAMYFNYKNALNQSRSGGHASIGASDLSYEWYMPEGYTGNGFDTYILLMNPNDEDAEACLKLMKPGEGRPYDFNLTVGAGRRVTVKINDLVWKEGQDNVIPTIATGSPTPAGEVGFKDCDVSTEIHSNKPIVCERSMYFDYYGKAGGSNSIAAPGAAPQWYLPEGYTGGDFDTWVLAMNPNCEPVDISYTFYSNAPGFQPVTVTHPGVKPYSRDSIHVDEVQGLSGTDVATKVTASKPVQLAAEQPKKYAFLYGVNDSGSGTPKYAENDVCDVKHKLAETGDFNYEYRLGAQATPARLALDMQWLKENMGPEDEAVFFFAGKSSGTDLVFSGGNVASAQLSGYFSQLNTRLVALLECDDGGEIADAVKGSGRIVISACSAGESANEYAALENGVFAKYFVEALSEKDADSSDNNLISAEEAFAYLAPKVTSYAATEGGAVQNPQIFDGIGGDLDLTVDKVPACIVAERSMYFRYGTAREGHTSIGASDTYPNWFLAEGYTGKGFDTYILVMNPFDYWQQLTATFMTPGGRAVEKKFDLPPRYRLTIKVNDMDPSLLNTDVSTRIETEPAQTAGVNVSCNGSGVVAERAMYFTYTDPQDGSKKTGGSCSIGYGSW